MGSTGFKDIVWFLVAPAFIVVIFTFGVSVNSIWALTSLILTGFVFARKFLVKKDWYQRASIVLAAFYGVGTFCTLIFQRHSDADIQAFALMLFDAFLVRTSTGNMNKPYQLIVRVSFFSIIILLGLILIFPIESDDYLFPSPIFAVFSIFSAFILLFLAFLKDENHQKENKKTLQKHNSTIHWFSMLVNLVSHNLRSPLANILSNAQLLEAKYPSVKDGEEIHRITSSVKTSTQIIDRLLKGTFVADRNSPVNLKESLISTYPQLHVIGVPKEMAYEESVSIHLSLEVFLDNAFRFSPDKVQLTFIDTRIEIRDYGKGMSKDEIEAFGRINNAALGTLHGLGIPFAQRILDIVDYGVKVENCDPGLLVTIHNKNNGNS